MSDQQAVCINCGKTFRVNYVNEDGQGGRARGDGIGASVCSRPCALQRDYGLEVIAQQDGDRSGVVVPIGTRTRWDRLR